MEEIAFVPPCAAAWPASSTVRDPTNDPTGLDVERDVIRGRWFEFGKRFMPATLSRLDRLPHLRPAETRFLSQVEARTYANVLAVVGTLPGAADEAGGADPASAGPQVSATPIGPAEAGGRLRLCRRLEEMAAGAMPPGYGFTPDAARLVGTGRRISTWTWLALQLHGELSLQRHYQASIGPDPALSALWQDAFFYFGHRSAQRAALGERRWRRADARLTAGQREQAVDELIRWWDDFDVLLRTQASRDAHYFLQHATPAGRGAQEQAIGDVLRAAYRWQFVVCGGRARRFLRLLDILVTPAQRERIDRALAPCSAAVAG